MITGPVGIVALGLAFGAASGSAIAGQAAASAATAAPLTLAARCEGDGQNAMLRVRLTNTSARDTAIVFGRLVGNDQTRVVDSLVVMAIRLATGANEDFAFVNPKHAMLTGRAAPWVVPIRAGGIYEFEAPLRFFISRLNYALLEPLAIPGTRLILEARPAPPAKVWTGTIETIIEPCP